MIVFAYSLICQTSLCVLYLPLTQYHFMALQTRRALRFFGLLYFSFNSKMLKNSVGVSCKMTILTMMHLCLKVFLVGLQTQTSSLRTSSLRSCGPLHFGHHIPGVVNPNREEKERVETKIKETQQAFPKTFTTPCQFRFQIRLNYFYCNIYLKCLIFPRFIKFIHTFYYNVL